jgi:hypothetical protein
VQDYAVMNVYGTVEMPCVGAFASKDALIAFLAEYPARVPEARFGQKLDPKDSNQRNSPAK